MLTAVSPFGATCPFCYFPFTPNDTLPLSAGLAGYAPAGELIQPPPVTKPPSVSTTMTYSNLGEAAPPSSSATVIARP